MITGTLSAIMNHPIAHG